MALRAPRPPHEVALIDLVGDVLRDAELEMSNLLGDGSVRVRLRSCRSITDPSSNAAVVLVARIVLSDLQTQEQEKGARRCSCSI